MQPIIAVTETQREQSRILINEQFSIYQYILRQDHDLISSKNRDKTLSGENKELIIVLNDNKVIGALLLELESKGYNAYTSYLVKHPSMAKEREIGKLLMTYSENRARNIHHKKKMRVSTVYHQEQTQERLENWYIKQGYKFLLNRSPTQEQQLAWKPEYRDALFKYFEKDL